MAMGLMRAARLIYNWTKGSPCVPGAQVPKVGQYGMVVLAHWPHEKDQCSDGAPASPALWQLHGGSGVPGGLPAWSF